MGGDKVVRTNRKAGGVCYQNRYAFKHNKNSKISRMIKELPLGGKLCRRCTEQLEWRKTYRKYKPQKEAKKCAWCKRFNIKLAYHVICYHCAKKKQVCSKCLDPRDEGEPEELTHGQLMYMLKRSILQERKKRSLVRRWEAGNLSMEQAIKKIGLPKIKENQKWRCPQCVYANAIKDKQCLLCTTKRPAEDTKLYSEFLKVHNPAHKGILMPPKKKPSRTGLTVKGLVLPNRGPSARGPIPPPKTQEDEDEDMESETDEGDEGDEGDDDGGTHVIPRPQIQQKEDDGDVGML